MLDLKRCTDSLAVIKSNPDEAAYAKEMFGIDVNDFSFNPNTKAMEMNPELSTYGSTANARDIKDRIVENILTRFDFHRKIGVPDRALDALPEQYLFQNSQFPERTNTEWQARIQEELNSNSGEFTPGNNFQSYSRMWEARRKVIAAMQGEKADRVRSGIDPARDISSIDGIVRSMTEDEGTIKKARTERFTSENARLQGDVAQFDRERTRVKEYKDLVDGLAATKKKAQEGYGVSNVDSLSLLIKQKKAEITKGIEDPNSYMAKKAAIGLREKVELKKRIANIMIIIRSDVIILAPVIFRYWQRIRMFSASRRMKKSRGL